MNRGLGALTLPGGIALGIAMLKWPLVAEWFVYCCIALAVIFGGIIVARTAIHEKKG